MRYVKATGWWRWACRNNGLQQIQNKWYLVHNIWKTRRLASQPGPVGSNIPWYPGTYTDIRLEGSGPCVIRSGWDRDSGRQAEDNPHRPLLYTTMSENIRNTFLSIRSTKRSLHYRTEWYCSSSTYVICILFFYGHGARLTFLHARGKTRAAWSTTDSVTVSSLAVSKKWKKNDQVDSTHSSRIKPETNWKYATSDSYL